MKKIQTLLLAFSLILIYTACKKDSSEDNNNNTSEYSPLTTGSTWTYESSNGSSYTLTSSGRDTVAQSKTYKVLTNSNGPNFYKMKSGTDHYQFVVIPELGATAIETIYLKEDAAINATWQSTQVVTGPNIPFPLTTTFKYTMKEKGIARTVKGKAYSDVIHVALEVSVAGLGALGGGDFYHAKGVGMIEGSMRLNFLGTEIVNETDFLTSHTIK